MHSKKLGGLILGVFTSIVLVAPVLSSAARLLYNLPVKGSPSTADGSPMPIPKPKPPALQVLVADGTPIPPLPPPKRDA